MFIPIPGTRPRKWMRIVIRAVENRWFDDFGEFYTYVIKNAEIVEIVEEKELVEDIIKSVRAWIEDGLPLDELREKISIIYGIPDAYVDLIFDRIKAELGLADVHF